MAPKLSMTLGFTYQVAVVVGICDRILSMTDHKSSVIVSGRTGHICLCHTDPCHMGHGRTSHAPA